MLTLGGRFTDPMTSQNTESHNQHKYIKFILLIRHSVCFYFFLTIYYRLKLSNCAYNQVE